MRLDEWNQVFPLSHDMGLFVGFLGLNGFLLLISSTSTLSPPLGYLIWKPLVLILSLVLPCIECFDEDLLISGLCLNHAYLSF